LAGSTGFMPQGWLNPDFTLYFRFAVLIRTFSRWCFDGVSGLKAFA